MDGSDDGALWNDSEEVGKGSSECKKMKALLVKMDTLQKKKKMETVTLIGEGR